ncbi:MAG: hypothetical protein HY252_11705 [Sphingobacteriales bacterium]|nr:hypothetical protein [Sphingobacteriales bacterium]
MDSFKNKPNYGNFTNTIDAYIGNICSYISKKMERNKQSKKNICNYTNNSCSSIPAGCPARVAHSQAPAGIAILFYRKTRCLGSVALYATGRYGAG